MPDEEEGGEGHEVEPGDLKPDAPEVDPDLPETDVEGEGDEEGEDDPPEETDPLTVVLPLHHAKELVDNLTNRGYEALAAAFLAVEAGETITIHVEV